MDQIIRIMIERLVGKGMELATIPAYVRDVANTFAPDPLLSLQELNRRLQLLGWFDFELDDHTLQLILVNSEREGLKGFKSGDQPQMEGSHQPDKVEEAYN